MHPRIPLAFLQPAHTAGSWLTCCPPGHPGPSPQSCSPAGPRQALMYGVIPPQVQDPAFAFVEPHQVSLCPSFQPIQVRLNGSTAFRCIYHTSQNGVISKLAEGTFQIFIQVVDKEVKQGWAQYRPLGDTSSHQPSTRLSAADDNPLSSAIQPSHFVKI